MSDEVSTPEEEEEMRPEEVPNRWLSKLIRKGALLVGIALLVGVLFQFTPLRALLEEISQGKDWIREWGWRAPLIFVGLTAFFVMVGVPRLVFCFLGGLSFGFVEGLLWSQIGTLMGAYGTYGYARFAGREWVLARLGKYPRLHRFLGNPTVLSVVLVRQIPVGGVFLNLALGVSQVRSFRFLFGSLLGFLPEAILVTLIGSGLSKDSPELMFLQVGFFSLLLLTALWWLWKNQTFRHWIKSAWKKDL